VIPQPRGALSEVLFGALTSRTRDRSALLRLEPDSDEDAQIALWALYEMHYRDIDGVDDALEWDPILLQVRRPLEAAFEAELRGRYRPHDCEQPFADELFRYIADHDGPAVSAYVQRNATAEQVLDLLRLRSIYHLKEFDPTAWVLPRLPVAAKASLTELAYDEYGAGNPNRLHSHLFARAMEASGLRSDYGAYIDEVPVEILEQNNAMTLLGLHRRLRGAALGHLAAFEATSSLPSRRMARGLERLGFDQALVGYYLEHVEADAVHEQLAVRAVCGTLVADEPRLMDDVFFGAFTCLDLEARFAAHALRSWAVPAGQQRDAERVD
jgi:ribosomal protein L30/L7E